MEALEKVIFYEYPAAMREETEGILKELAAEDTAVYAVIDDDPTGGQTVHDVDVYTSWDEDALADALSRDSRMFYIMTNSRSFTESETVCVHNEIMENLKNVAARMNRTVRVISRGDSTLRGHYPLETDVIRAHIGRSDVRELLIPYFQAGNRYTVNDVHYMLSDGKIIPVGESEFSRDKTFGYRASNLKEWIEEKNGGRVAARQVASVSLEMLRSLDFDGIEAVLTGEKRHIIVNATCSDDLKVFAVSYLRALKRGYEFVARTASDWPKVIGMVSDQPLLSGGDLAEGAENRGGLVVIGSHVKKTTEQFEMLRAGIPQLTYIEFNQHTAIQPRLLEEEVKRVANEAGEAIRASKSCVVYTRRERIDLNSGSGENELLITQRIAKAVTDIVRSLGGSPRFILTKGGITSSDIAVRALGVRHAVIRGQIAPGVPVWRLGSECLYPNVDYIIFPGNVGESGTLKNIVEKLLESKEGKETR